jgi:hypothetical protein
MQARVEIYSEPAAVTTGPAFDSALLKVKAALKHEHAIQISENQANNQVKVQTTRQRKAFLRFLGTIVFTAAFMVLVWLHEDITHVYEIEKIMHSIQDRQFGAYGKTFSDVGNMAEVWEWTQFVLIPCVIQNHDSVTKLCLYRVFDRCRSLFVFQVGRYLPTLERGYIYQYNRIIGALRVMQVRGDKRRCSYRKLEHLSESCYPEDGESKKSSFGFPECNDTAAMETYSADWDLINDGANRPCYNAKDYESVVDIEHNEGFEGNLEM